MAAEVRKRLWISVQERLPHEGDVAVTLSGGLDSSIIAGMVAMMLKNDPGRKMVCFTIGFDGRTFPDAAQYDETGEWRRVHRSRRPWCSRPSHAPG